MRTSLPIALLLLSGLGVAAYSPRSSGSGASDPTYGLDAYCDIGGLDGLYDWTGSAVVTCAGLSAGSGEEPIDASTCGVSTIDNGGHAQSTTFENVQGAQVLGDGRVLVWGFDGSLSLRRGSEPAHMIADLVLDPWLDATRNRVAYVAPAAGATSLEPGDDRRVVVYDLAAGTELEVLADSSASSPVAIPGTDDLLYVSSAGGVAAIFRATARVASADPTPDACTGGRTGDPSDPASECTPPDTSSAFVQLTNLTPEIPQTNFPPFARQHVFVGESDTLRLVYAALVTTESGAIASEIFTLDPRTGDSEDLGPGSFPQHGPHGSVLARTADSGCMAVQYLAPGATP
jgi:hypothetical protein